MEPFRTISGAAAPLFEPDISTDLIIPSRQITSTSREGYGPKLFTPWRYLGDGNENPDFILNRAGYRESRILFAGENFGCGSSREMAVWALRQFGIQCIVAPSYGAIFRDNCLRNGLLPVCMPRQLVQELAAQAAITPGSWTIDLANVALKTPAGLVHTFEMHDGERRQFMQGLDPIAATLQLTRKIDEFVSRDQRARPGMWLRR